MATNPTDRQKLATACVTLRARGFDVVEGHDPYSGPRLEPGVGWLESSARRAFGPDGNLCGRLILHVTGTATAFQQVARACRKAGLVAETGPTTGPTIGAMRSGLVYVFPGATTARDDNR